MTRAAPTALIPRFIRLRDAPRYLGMDKNRFNREVRRHVPAIRIGTQGIAFDRIDLDTWADQHKYRNGRPAAERSKPWDEASTDKCQDSSFAAESGTSTKSYTAGAFAKALASDLEEAEYDYDTLTALAEGNTSLGGAATLREGLVVRAVPERVSDAVRGRAIAKFVGDGYLTRAGGSEFE